MALPKLEQAARDAVMHYTRQCLALVARRGGRGDGEILGHGSGTLIRADRGAFVLTAKHVVRDHRSFTVMCPDAGQARLRDVEPILHPRADIAVIPVAEPALVNRACTAEVFADITSVGKGAQLVVTGFPEHMTFVEWDDRGPVKSYSDITHFGVAVGSDARAISINWREAELDEERAVGLARLGMRPGRQPLKKPEGISGGAVWLLARPEPDRLWSPTAATRLMGVSYEFSNGRQLAAPVWCWRDWLLELLE